MTDASPKIFDCFTFSNELDVLQWRLELLDDVVDRFVVVEATRTHSGLDKDLDFAANRDRFAAFADKIVHVVVDDLPSPDPDRWVGERYQRNAIERGLSECAPDDLVVVSDVDELPDPGVLARLRSDLTSTVALDIRACYYRANWEAAIAWPLVRVARRRAMPSPQDLRVSDPMLRVVDAGVHLSYLMDVPAILEKYRAFAHDELDTERASSERFVDAMRELRLFAPTRERLTVRGRDALNDVQRWLLARDPSIFDFEDAAGWAKTVGVKWAGVRARDGVPSSLVRAGDRALAAFASVRPGRGGGRGGA